MWFEKNQGLRNFTSCWWFFFCSPIPLLFWFTASIYTQKLGFSIHYSIVFFLCISIFTSPMIFTLLCTEYFVPSSLLPSLSYFHKLVFNLIWFLYCSNIFILLYTKNIYLYLWSLIFFYLELWSQSDGLKDFVFFLLFQIGRGIFWGIVKVVKDEGEIRVRGRKSNAVLLFSLFIIFYLFTKLVFNNSK
jgi:hypothetical protein